MSVDRTFVGLSSEERRTLERLSKEQRKAVSEFNLEQLKTLVEMVFLMDKCIPLRGSDLVGRLVGPLTEGEVWELIELAATAGIIERARMLAPTSRLMQRWRLVGGSHPELTNAYT